MQKGRLNAALIFYREGEMVTIIQEGNIGTVFKLKNREIVEIKVGEGGGIYKNDISDDVFNMLMQEYGSYIQPRIKSDENPDGCFMILTNEVPNEEEKQVKKNKKKKEK